jgi:hypothetical protein
MGLSPDGIEVLQEAKENAKYYSTEYPFTIFGRGIMNNLGFTKVEWIDKYRNEIVLTLGQCVIQGRVGCGSFRFTIMFNFANEIGKSTCAPTPYL